jgi:hypothetical protein
MTPSILGSICFIHNAPSPHGLHRRRAQCGASAVEMALVLLPFMALALGIIDFSLPIFLKSTFTHAVREGCRFGVTYNLRYGGNTYSSQTNAIKAVVQANAMGFLSGESGADRIFVEYYSPVSPYGLITGPGANASGNILRVSVRQYGWNWLAPIWRTSSPLSINASSADRLEPFPVGVALPTP